MASLISVQSKKTLDVSQSLSRSPTPNTPEHDAASPGSQSASQNINNDVQIQETLEMVEDSFNDDYAVHAPGPSRPMAGEEGDDDDEDLYGLSPETKSRHDAAKLFTEANHQASFGGPEHPPLTGDRQQISHHSSLKGVEIPAAPINSRKSTCMSAVFDNSKAPDERPKPSTSACPPTRATNSDKAQQPAKEPAPDPPRRLTRAAKQSAVEALRSKRETRGEAAEKPDYGNVHETMVRPALTTHTPTPLTNGNAYREPEKRPASGKLPTYNAKTTAAMPIPVKAPAVAKQAVALADANSYENSDGKLPTGNAKRKAAGTGTAAAKAPKLSKVKDPVPADDDEYDNSYDQPAAEHGEVEAAVSSTAPADASKLPKRKAAAPDDDDEYGDSYSMKRPKGTLPKQAIKKKADTSTKTKQPAGDRPGGPAFGTQDTRTSKTPGLLKRPSQLGTRAKAGKDSKDIFDVLGASDEPRTPRKNGSPAKRPKPVIASPRIGGQARRRTQGKLSPEKRDPASYQPRRMPQRAPTAGDPVALDQLLRRPAAGRRRRQDHSDEFDDLEVQAEEPVVSPQRPEDADESVVAIQPDKDVGTGQAPCPGGADSPKKQAQGSQQYPIDISETGKSSPASSTADSNTAFRSEQVPAEAPKQRYATPTPMPSSPPLVGTMSRGAPESAKTRIIAFNESGPRNQGTGRRLQLESKASGLAKPVFSSRASQVGSSLPGSISKQSVPAFESLQRRREAAPIAPPNQQRGNVAGMNENIFQAFGLSKKVPASETRQSGSRVESGADHKPAASAPQRPSVRPQSSAHAGQSRNLETENTGVQQGQRMAAEEDDHFATLDDDMDGTTLVDIEPLTNGDFQPPTASQTAMPPPPGKSRTIVKAQPAPVVPEISSVRAKKPLQLEMMPALPKRKLEVIPNDGERSSTKRRKPDNRAEKPQKALPESKTPQARSNRVPRSHSPRPQPRQRISLVPPPPLPRAVRRISKPLRQSSQPNVDVLGSPHPRDFDVPAQSTALEIYASQNMSSDETGREGRLTPPHRDEAVSSPMAIPYPLLASGQAEARRTTTKTRSTDPRASARGSHVKVSQAVVEKLLRQDRMREPPTDPFTSSKDSHEVSSAFREESDFAGVMRERRFLTSQGESRAAQANSRTCSKGADSSTRSHDEHGNEENEDADKTLVGSEPEEHQRASKHQRSKQSRSDPTPPGSPDNIEDQYDSLGTWRLSLKPHQMALFDSLVIVSHKIVRTLVDKETAARDVVDDYRRKGESIVAELENLHRATYEKALQRVAQHKLNAAQKLSDGRERLRRAMKEDTAGGEKVRVRSAASCDEIEEQLNGLMAKICG